MAARQTDHVRQPLPAEEGRAFKQTEMPVVRAGATAHSPLE